MPCRLSQLSLKAILSIGSAPRPQALILLKIAAATRTYGLDFYREAFVLLTMWWKGNSDCSVFENDALFSSKIMLTNTGK